MLHFGLTFEDLYTDDGLIKIYDAYLSHGIGDMDLVAHAKELEHFLVELFQIQNPYRELGIRERSLDPVFHIKRQFVQRRALKQFSVADLQVDPGIRYTESQFVTWVSGLLHDEPSHQQEIQDALYYGAWASLHPQGQAHHKDDVLFNHPQPTDVWQERLTPQTPIHNRRDFSLTDQGPTDIYGLDQAHYCIICHPRGKDSCSHGRDDSAQGCPLDQRISEMNFLYRDGYILGALAMITRDNPMVAITGHRICNDCMGGCIYQKQDPVDIPAIDSRILKELLALPLGLRYTAC